MRFGGQGQLHLPLHIGFQELAPSVGFLSVVRRTIFRPFLGQPGVTDKIGPAPGVTAVDIATHVVKPLHVEAVVIPKGQRIPVLGIGSKLPRPGQCRCTLVGFQEHDGGKFVDGVFFSSGDGQLPLVNERMAHFVEQAKESGMEGRFFKAGAFAAEAIDVALDQLVAKANAPTVVVGVFGAAFQEFDIDIPGQADGLVDVGGDGLVETRSHQNSPEGLELFVSDGPINNPGVTQIRTSGLHRSTAWIVAHGGEANVAHGEGGEGGGGGEGAFEFLSESQRCPPGFGGIMRTLSRHTALFCRFLYLCVERFSQGGCDFGPILALESFFINL